MWQREFVATIILIAIAIMMKASSASKMRAPPEANSNFSVAVADAVPAEDQGARIRLLRMKARRAMCDLILEHIGQFDDQRKESGQTSPRRAVFAAGRRNLAARSEKKEGCGIGCAGKDFMADFGHTDVLNNLPCPGRRRDSGECINRARVVRTSCAGLVPM
jgi:hypothetical protein